MDSPYSEKHRALQQAFGTAKLADFLDAHHVHEGITADEKAFVEGRDMVFLSTVDPDGNPTVSYKGGTPGEAGGGFVKVLSDTRLAFPGYDGDGLFHSLGNIEGQGKVGLLFIDFETPHRMRMQDTARLERQSLLLPNYPGAQYVVDVAKVWVNCPRDVHTCRRVETSKYVPAEDKPAPLAAWKRIDGPQQVLPDADRAKASADGPIGEAENVEKLARDEA